MACRCVNASACPQSVSALGTQLFAPRLRFDGIDGFEVLQDDDGVGLAGLESLGVSSSHVHPVAKTPLRVDHRTIAVGGSKAQAIAFLIAGLISLNNRRNIRCRPAFGEFELRQSAGADKAPKVTALDAAFFSGQ